LNQGPQPAGDENSPWAQMPWDCRAPPVCDSQQQCLWLSIAYPQHNSSSQWLLWWLYQLCPCKVTEMVVIRMCQKPCFVWGRWALAVAF
jgi:hypothetical protein